MSDLRTAAEAAQALVNQFQALKVLGDQLGAIADLDSHRAECEAQHAAAVKARDDAAATLSSVLEQIVNERAALEAAKSDVYRVIADAQAQADKLVADATAEANRLGTEVQAQIAAEREAEDQERAAKTAEDDQLAQNIAAKTTQLAELQEQIDAIVSKLK